MKRVEYATYLGIAFLGLVVTDDAQTFAILIGMLISFQLFDVNENLRELTEDENSDEETELGIE